MMNKFGIGRFRAVTGTALLPLFMFLSLEAYAQQTVSPQGPGLIGDYFNFPEGNGNGNPPFPPGTPSMPLPPANNAGFPGGPFPVISPEQDFLQRLDATVNFQSFTGANAPPGVNADVQKWGAVWYGYLTIPTTTTYTFGLGTDDGGRMWVSPTALTTTPTIDNWATHEGIAGAGGNKQSGAITLTGGTVYMVRVEMWQDQGGVGAQLWWKANGAAAYTIVPAFTAGAGGLSSPVPCGAPNLTAFPANGTTAINLSWTPSGTGEAPTAYNIFKATTAGTEGTTPIATVTGTTYQDTAVTFGQTYFYIVQPTAFGGLFIGNPSNEVSCAPNPFSVSPTTLQVIENGGTGQLTITTALPIPSGTQVTFPIQVQNLTSAGTPCFNVSGGGAGPAASINAVMTGNNTAGQTMIITITGIDDQVANNPFTGSIVFGLTSCNPANATFTNDTLPPVTCTQIESDIAGVIISPNSGLSITNGGPPIQFQVKLATKPSAPVTLNLASTIPYSANLSPMQLTFDSTTWDTFQPVTITPNNVDTTQQYVAPFYISFTPVQSTDMNYAGIDPGTVYVFELTETPPLKKVWGKCGLTGLEGLAVLAALAAWRRRRRA